MRTRKKQPKPTKRDIERIEQDVGQCSDKAESIREHLDAMEWPNLAGLSKHKRVEFSRAFSALARGLERFETCLEDCDEWTETWWTRYHESPAGKTWHRRQMRKPLR